MFYLLAFLIYLYIYIFLVIYCKYMTNIYAVYKFILLTKGYYHFFGGGMGVFGIKYLLQENVPQENCKMKRYSSNFKNILLRKLSVIQMTWRKKETVNYAKRWTVKVYLGKLNLYAKTISKPFVNRVMKIFFLLLLMHV